MSRIENWRRVCGQCSFVLLAFLFCACRGTSTSTSASKVPATENLSSEQMFKYNSYFLEAICQKEKDNNDAEYELLSRALEIRPNAPEAIYEMALLQLGFEHGDSIAVAMLQKAIALAPQESDYKHVLASIYDERGEYDKAIEVYENMAKGGEKTEDVYSRLAELYEHQHNYTQEIYTLNRIEELIGKSELTAMKKYSIYLQLNDSARAYNEVESLCREYPGDMRYQVVLGDYWERCGNNEKAFEVYNNVLQRDSSNVFAQASLLDYYRKNGPQDLYIRQFDKVFTNPDAYEDLLARAINQWVNCKETNKIDSITFYNGLCKVVALPTDSRNIAESVEQYLDKNNWPVEAIIPIGRRVLQIEPEYDDARLRQMLRFIRTNNADSLSKLCKEGINYNPRFIVYYYYQGISLLQQGHTGAALSTFKQGVAKCDTTIGREAISDTYAAIGDLLHERRDNQGAYMAYDMSLQYNPDNILALNNYSYFLSLEMARLDDAERMSKKTIDAEPENPTYLDTYAWILFVQKKYQAAQTYIDKTLKYVTMTPDNAGIVEHAGDIYAQCGQKTEAVNYWKRALSLSIKSDQRNILKKKIRLRKYISQ